MFFVSNFFFVSPYVCEIHLVLHMALSLLCGFPFYEHTTMYFSILFEKNIWVVSVFGAIKTRAAMNILTHAFGEHTARVCARGLTARICTSFSPHCQPVSPPS